ncbi:MAG: SusC/RagA family TonB-linked outer membrane protein, partial [Flavobacteriaceae bacterium]|nr:SusC/RagA family TonB-linked outer membrane protein [Flavobacteriaceae bacterium]
MKTKFRVSLALFLALIVHMVYAQEKTVTGTVSDESGPLPGVSILVKGTTVGTETDFDGKYAIQVKTGDVLVFSYVGMLTQQVTVGTSNVINVVMQNDNVLDEVVVIGYGTQKKSEVTGAISQVKGEDMAQLITPSFDQQLAGRAAGVQITTATGIIGEAPRIRIRGIASIDSGTYPLVVVDGVPIYTGDLGGYANTNSLGDIHPSDIESFEILKDGASTAIYGSRAANGVILITTKKGKQGSMAVEYNTTLGFASPVKTFDLLQTPDFLVIANEKRTNRGQEPWAVGSEYNTDWQGAVLKDNALQLDHILSLNGGSEKTRYYMSLGYTEQKGVAKSNEMTRYTMRTNIEHNVNKWFKIGGNISLTRTEYRGLNTGTGSLSGNIFNAMRQLPNTPIYDPNHPTG